MCQLYGVALQYMLEVARSHVAHVVRFTVSTNVLDGCGHAFGEYCTG